MTGNRFCLVSAISVAFILSFASVVGAQIDVGNFTISGEAEVVGVPQSRSGERSKFEEYRNVPETVIVPDLKLKINSKKNDYFLEFDSAKVGLDDQDYRLRFGRYGLFNVELEWDQVPHLFNSDTAATPFARSDGTFTLASKPTVTGSLDCTTVGHTCQWVNSNSERINLKLLQGFARLKVRYTPMPGWTFNAAYQSQNTSGDRAFGTVTNGFSNIVELAEPTDYQTHNIEVGGEYTASRWTLGLKYNASLFHNNTSTLVWDNPFNITGVGAACVDAVASTCRGRLDLYPSNQAHTWTLTGTAVLPLKTRFMGTVSYGMRLQDDSFQPFTINTAVAQPVLRRSSLDGDVRPTMVNVTLVNRLFDRLDLKTYYRLYDLDNRSKRLFLEGGYIRSDTGAARNAADGLTSFPYAYSKQNIGLDARYDITRWLSGKLSYGWERMHRERREVLNGDEQSFGPTIDIKPAYWLLFRGSYRRYLRKAPNYDAGRAVVYETGETPNEIREDRLAALRKFDEAARRRNKLGFFTQVTPLENVTLHGGFDFTSDHFPRSDIGAQRDVNYSPSVGFVYGPVPWANFFGDYNWDRVDWKMRAMQRSNVAQTPEGDPDRLWTSRGTDRVHTFSLGTDLKLIESLLGLRLQYGFSYGESLVHASGSTCAGCTQATDYPSITNRWHELLARFEYSVHKNVDLRFGYYFNRYSSKDFGVDIMKLWMGDVDAGANDSIFLGDRLKGSYEAHVGFMGLRFKF